MEDPPQPAMLFLCDECVCASKKRDTTKTLGLIRAHTCMWYGWSAETLAILNDKHKYPDNTPAKVCHKHKDRLNSIVYKDRREIRWRARAPERAERAREATAARKTAARATVTPSVVIASTPSGVIASTPSGVIASTPSVANASTQAVDTATLDMFDQLVREAQEHVRRMEAALASGTYFA